MTPGILIGLILFLLAAAGILLISEQRRRKALTTRLTATIPGGQIVRTIDAPNIRVRQQKAMRFAVVARLLQMPIDVPQAHVISPAMVVVMGIVISFCAFYLSSKVFSETTAAVIGALTGIAMTRGLFAWEMNKYRDKLVKQLPDVVQLVVSATRAGLPVSEAFRAIAKEMPSPTKEEFLRVEKALALGDTPDQALLAMHQRTGVSEYAIFAVTIGVQARSGGRLAETMQNLAETVRDRLAIVAKAKAASSEAKASGVIMGALPFVVGLFQTVMEPAKMALMVNDPRGLRMLAIGVGTLVAGILTMRQLIAGVAKD